MSRPLLLPLALSLLPVLAFAANEGHGGSLQPKDRDPGTVSIDDTADVALKKFSVAPGLRVDVWAAEPLLANPVAFAFDDKGRAFVAETYRRRTSVPDIRKHETLTLENLALRTVEDRLEFLKVKFPTSAARKPDTTLTDFDGNGTFDFRDWGIEAERVKLLTDTKGAGVADTATVYATVPSSPVTGLGAGVAVRGGVVFHTVAPDLWRYDGEQTGASTQQKSLLHGFAVHVAFGGHDMHGVKFGPDGKVYWTIADCGARVTTLEGPVLDNPDSGAVFRSDLDGRNAELVAIGLRNPQSLAFNDLGDLFTGDNNADGGDKARWTHIVDGADYGWRIGWQFLKAPMLLGAWNSEGMWHLDVAETHATILPPVALIGHGPAGIAWYPGTGLPEKYRDHFFYADFPGGVRAFTIQSRGASYTAENPGDILQDNQAKNMTGKLLWGLFPSDVQFGVDGGVYVLDWIQGWEKTGKGRIYRVHDPVVDASAIVQETKALLAAGFDERPAVELLKLLAHADQRVRLGAQFALVAKGDVAVLAQAAAGEGPLLGRLHGAWGLGQLAPTSVPAAEALLPLLSAAVAEVRAQAAKVVGSAGLKAVAPRLVKLLADPAPRVRFFAAQSLARLPAEDAVPALFKLLHETAGSDPFIRHAAVVALARQADTATLAAKAKDPSEFVRLGALLALRRQASPEVARFLADPQPRNVAEAARAIHDGPILAALPQLAALGLHADDEPVTRRVANANYLVGDAASAQRLATAAANAQAPAAIRLEAIASLAEWNQRFYRNRVTGLFHPLPATREAGAALAATAPVLPALLQDADETTRIAAADLAGALKATTAEPALLSLLADAKNTGKTRAAALRALDAIGSAKLADAVRAALTSADKTFVETARQLAGRASPQLAVEVNAAVLGKGSIREQQEALATIAQQAVPEADKVLLAQFDALAAGKLPRGVWLDLFEAAGQRDSAELKARLAARTAQAANDPKAKWSECVEGGDAKIGKAIFAEKAEAACMRCHKVKGVGGDVGPELAGIGKTKDRAYLLQAIVDPNAVIAPGFENVLLTLTDGKMVVGLLNKDDGTELTIISPADGKREKVRKDLVKERTSVPSAMPPGLGEVLGARALRDMVEYLSTVK